MSDSEKDRWQLAGQTGGTRFLLMAACVVIVISGIKAASGLILPFLISLFLALITLPLLNWLIRKKIPMPLAVLITIIAALSVLTAIVFVIGGSVNNFTDEVPKYKDRLDVMSTSILDWLQAHGIDVSKRMLTGLLDPAKALDVATGALGGLVAALSQTFLVLLTIVLILFEAAGFPDKLSRAFGKQSGSDRYEKIKLEIQSYLAIKTLTSLFTGIVISVALAIIGVDFPLLWGMLAFLLNYIPNLGSIISAIPPILLALIGLGPGQALAVAIVFVVVNVSLGNFVEPYFMGRRLGLSTLVVFMSLVFWGWVWGPLGMLLSVPLTMILKIMLENTEDLRWIAVLLGPGQQNSRK